MHLRWPQLFMPRQHFRDIEKEAESSHSVRRSTQLPVFVTTMWAARRMALLKWAGIEQGGLGWFPDLTVPALDLSAPTVQYLIPLGSVGIVMPVLVVAGMFGNLALAFGDSGAASGRCAHLLTSYGRALMQMYLNLLDKCMHERGPIDVAPVVGRHSLAKYSKASSGPLTSTRGSAGRSPKLPQRRRQSCHQVSQ